MLITRWFRRARPTPPPRLDPHEARIISAWGLTEAEWDALTGLGRAYLRTNYTKAPRYTQ
jgi:hypothetical protein